MYKHIVYDRGRSVIQSVCVRAATASVRVYASVDSVIGTWWYRLIHWPV